MLRMENIMNVIPNTMLQN